MFESFVLSVEVSDEVFGAFGKVEYGFEIDYLGTCCFDGGKCLGEQFEQSHVGFYLLCLFGFMCVHIYSYFYPNPYKSSKLCANYVHFIGKKYNFASDLTMLLYV